MNFLLMSFEYDVYGKQYVANYVPYSHIGISVVGEWNMVDLT